MVLLKKRVLQSFHINHVNLSIQINRYQVLSFLVSFNFNSYIQYTKALHDYFIIYFSGITILNKRDEKNKEKTTNKEEEFTYESLTDDNKF